MGVVHRACPMVYLGNPQTDDYGSGIGTGGSVLKSV